MDVDGLPRTKSLRTLLARLKEHPLARVGPGLITGVADDDPNGIASYSQAGALFEAMGWHEGLERKVRDASGFYAIIAISVLAALAIQYSPISPMKALFWSAVINGVAAVPLLVVIMILVSSKSVMGAFTASRPLIVLGSIATLVMGVAALLMLLPG